MDHGGTAWNDKNPFFALSYLMLPLFHVGSVSKSSSFTSSPAEQGGSRRRATVIMMVSPGTGTGVEFIAGREE